MASALMHPINFVAANPAATSKLAGDDGRPIRLLERTDVQLCLSLWLDRASPIPGRI